MKGALAIRYSVPIYGPDEQMHRILHNVEIIKEYCRHFNIHFYEIPAAHADEYIIMMYEGSKIPKRPEKFVVFEWFEAKSKKYDDMLQIVGAFFQYYD